MTVRFAFTIGLIAGSLACVPTPTPSTPSGVSSEPPRRPERPGAPEPDRARPAGPWTVDPTREPNWPATPVPAPRPSPIDDAPLPAPWPVGADAVAGVDFDRMVLADEDVVGLVAVAGEVVAGTATGGLFKVDEPAGWRPMVTALPPLRALFGIGDRLVACPADGSPARMSRDGGRAWVRLDMPCGAGQRRTVVGIDGHLAMLRPDGRIRVGLGDERIVDPGLASPMVIGATKDLLVVFGRRDGVVSGDAGASFVPIRRLRPAAVSMPRDVALGGKGRGVVVGRAAQGRVGIEFTRDAGRTWIEADAPARLAIDLAAVAADDRGVFYATPAHDGPALVSRDGGETWRPLPVRRAIRGPVLSTATGALAGTPRGISVGLDRTSPRGPGLDRPLWRTVFSHPRLGVAVGVLGGIWRTVDGGIRWSLAPGTGSLPFTDLDRVADHGVVAVGEGLFRWSDDAGRRWTVSPPPGSCQARWTRFVDLRGLADCADGRAVLSEDGGVSWRPLDRVPERGPVVWLNDSTAVTLLADGRIGWSIDGGLTFALTAPPGVLVELVPSSVGVSALGPDGTRWVTSGPDRPWQARPLAAELDGPAVTHRPLLDSRVALATHTTVFIADREGRIRRIGPAPGARAIATPGDGRLVVMQLRATTVFMPR